VHLIFAAGGLWVGTAANTLTRRERAAGLAIRTGILFILLAALAANDGQAGYDEEYDNLE